MARDSAEDRVKSLEGERNHLLEANRKLEAREAKREARLKHIEAELAKSHEAARSMRAQLAANPADAHRGSALNLAAERATALAVFKQQASELGAQKAKLLEELNGFKERAESAFNALKSQLEEKKTQLKELSSEFDRICAETGAKPKGGT
jgi:chromosome segregation ATPase